MLAPAPKRGKIRLLRKQCSRGLFVFTKSATQTLYNLTIVDKAPVIWASPALFSKTCGRLNYGSFVMVSKLQRRTRHRLEILFDHMDVIENHRPDWLKNEETGRNLELDFYFPGVKIGIEVQGRQHQTFVPHFHGTEQGFREQQERDKLKAEICEREGVFLYEVFSPDDIEGFIDAVKGHSKEMHLELNNKHMSLKALSYFSARLQELVNRRNNGNIETAPENKIAKLVARITRLAAKYNIPLQDIEPDFTIKKIEMAFGFKPIIKIQECWCPPEEAKRDYAAIIEWDFDTGWAAARWLHKGRYHDLEFDLYTGQPLQGEKNWMVRVDTLPDWMKRELKARGEDEL